MNRTNLIKLANGLFKHKSYGARFDMRQFCSSESFYYTTDCGTVGCAVGFGPFCGIPKFSYETWREYSYKFIDPFYNSDWAWCFGSAWSTCDNTRKGAARRITYLLRNGKPPESFDRHDKNSYKKCLRFYKKDRYLSVPKA